MPNAQALSGIRVLEISGTIPGSITAMLLGDFGAEVIHVAPPSRIDAEEAPGEVMWNRNKACTSVDWSSPADLELLRALVISADVCITTEQAAVDALQPGASANTRLVHVHMPSNVPLESGGLELESLLSSSYGVARRQSSFDGGPIDPVYPHNLYEQGAWAAAAAIAALVERESSGSGQRIDVDGLHGVLAACTPALVIDPKAPPQVTAVGPAGPNPAYATYRCSDGKWLFFAALTAKFQAAAFEVMGLTHVNDDPRVNRVPANLYTPANREWVKQAIADAFSKNTREYWLTSLTEAGCPVGPVNERDTWLDHPQVDALGQRKTVTDPVHGEVVMGGTAVELSTTPAREPEARRFVSLAKLPAWPVQPAQPAAGATPPPLSGHGPLHGVRVLDLGTILAGPYSGMLLAELGADVVKVEPPAGDEFRVTGFHYNRGQRSLAVNLRDPQGHGAFLALAAKSDVVIDNSRPGVLERLKVDYNTLTSVRADIISLSITAFGTVGPLGGGPGFDPLLQALSGIMAAQGGDSDPVFLSLAVNDVTSAVFGVLGICAALFHRARTGEGQRISATLAASSVYMQSGEIVRYRGRPAPRVGGRDFPGPTAFDRLYETSDGHVRVFAKSRDPFVEAGLLPVDGTADSDVAAIQATPAPLSREAAVARLTAPGIAAVIVRHFGELPNDAAILEGQYLIAQQSDDGAVFYLPSRYARFSRSERQGTLTAPGTGEHSRELLTEAGLSDAEIDAAIEAGTVAVGPPMTRFQGVSYR